MFSVMMFLTACGTYDSINDRQDITEIQRVSEDNIYYITVAATDKYPGYIYKLSVTFDKKLSAVFSKKSSLSMCDGHEYMSVPAYTGNKSVGCVRIFEADDDICLMNASSIYDYSDFYVSSDVYEDMKQTWFADEGEVIYSGN